MLLKDLVLYSMEGFDSFVVDNKELTKQAYLNQAHLVVHSYYLDIIDNQAKMVITLEEFN